MPGSPSRVARCVLSIAASIFATSLALGQTPPPAVYHDDFQSYGTQANPPGFVDSSIGSNSPSAGGLYKTWPDPLQSGNIVYGTKQASGKPDGRNPRIGTFSTLTTYTFAGKGRFEYRGRFLRTNSDTRVGLTFFSAAPGSDSYYLVGLWEEATTAKLTMQLFSASGPPAGVVDSGFTPEVNRWYRFLIQADDVDGATKIRARFWVDGTDEPKTFSIDAADASPSRLTSGRIGIWSAVRGDAFVDDLDAKSPVDHTPPSIALFESGNELDPKSIAQFGRDARIEIRIADDLSTFTSTATLDGSAYISQDAITAEGMHALHVHAVDAPGNAADAELKLIIDKSPPQIVVTESGKPLVSGALFNRDVVLAIVATDFTATKLTALLDGQPFVSGTAVTGEGQHALSVHAEDAVGFTTDIAPIVFTIDKTPPHVTFTSPAAGQTITTAHTIVAGGADDAVSITVNGVATVIDAARRFTTTKSIDLFEGENTLTAVAIDKAGNRGTTAVNVIVDTRGPELSVSSPLANSCLNATAVEFRGRATDAGGSSVKVKSGNTSVDATFAADGVSWTATLPAASEGPLSFSVTASDPAGHTSVIVLPVTIDRTRPVVEVSEGGKPFTAPAVNRPIALFPRTIDADRSARLEARLDGAPYTSGTLIAAEGPHELRATATDCAGNVSDEKVVSFAIDRTPPQITDVVPPSGATVGEKPTVRGHVSADCGRVVVEGPELLANVASGNFEFSALPLKEGPNQFVFIATDAAGNETRFPYSLTVKTAVPFVSITENGSVIATNAVFRCAVVPVIASSDPTATITATLNSAPFTSGTSIAADGDYVLAATAADRFSHTSSTTVTFTIDRTPPVVTITSPATGATIRSDHVDVTGTAAAADLASVTVNGTTDATAAGGAFTVSIPLDIGPNLIAVIATDRHGNSSTASVAVTRDDGRLALVLLTPADRSLTNRPTTVVTGQVLTPASGATLAVNGTDAPIDAAGLFRIPGFALHEGDNAIVATLRAPNGAINQSAVHVTADFTPPVLKVLANGSDLVNGARFTVSPSLAVDASDGNGVTTRVTLDGAAVTLPLSTLTDGGHALTVIARDAAGNETRVDRSFVIGVGGSATGCQLTALDPPNDSGVVGETIRISGGAAGTSNVLVNGTRAQIADGSFCGIATLQPGRNDVRVDCADANGTPTGPPTILTLYRQADTTIVITAPRSGDVIGSSKVSVTGTVGAGVVYGDVNGLPFSAPNDGAASHTFTVDNVPLANGLNVIVARGRTTSSRVAMSSVRVKYFGSSPQIAITSPLPGSDAGTAIDVSGTYTNIDPSTMAAAVGAASFSAVAKPQSDTTGTFVIPSVVLAVGKQTITVSGRSRGGIATSAAVDVQSVLGGASIAITAPADNTFYASDAAKPDVINGVASPAAGANVQVNGVPAPVDASGHFTATVDFTATVTPIIARVTTPDGSSASDAIRIIRFSRPLSIIDSYPAANAVEVDPGVLIVLLLSNPVNGATVASSVRMTDSAGAAVDGEIFVDKDAISFAPVSPLIPGMTYTFSAATTLKDVAGGALASAYALTFSIAGSAPAVAPQVDQQDAAGCFTKTIITGHASAAGARMRLDVDGVTMTATSAADKSFRFEFTLSGQPGFHLARVRQVGADGTMSPEAAVCFRLNCAGPQVVSASIDRAAKKLVIQFSRPMKASTLSASSGGTIRVSASGVAIAGELALNAASDTATITMTADLSSQVVTLIVKREVQDAAGIPMAADYTQSFPVSSDEPGRRGEGYVSGAVYDETTGRPLASAQVDIAAPVNAFSHHGAASPLSAAPAAIVPPLPAGEGGASPRRAPGEGRATAKHSAPRLQPIAFDTGSPITDDRGRYTRPLAEGAYTLQASASGYATAWRQVIVPAGAGVVPIDIRLSRRAPEQIVNGSAMTLAHGGETAATKPAELSIAASSLATGKKISLTSLASQAVPGLLPLGWSPLAAAEIAVDSSSISATLPAAKLTFTLTADDVAALNATAQTLSLVQYETDRDEWRTIAGVATVDANRRASFDITSSGDYALVYPDKASNLSRPLPARSGAALQGVANPCTTAPDVCRLSSRSFILNPQSVLPNGITTATLTTDGTKAYPSGTAVQATIDEQLNLADGRVVLDPPFSTDLLVYRTIAGDSGVAIFHLAPTTQAAAAMLRDGVDHIRIVDYPGRVDRGAIIGSEGGRVAGDDAVAIDIPSGAAAEALHATAVAMSNAEIAGFGAVAGFHIAAGFTVSLTRVADAPPPDGTVVSAPTLLKPARGTFTINAAAGAQVIVGEVLDATRFGSMVRLAAPTSVIGSAASGALRTFTTRPIDPATLPVDGIVRGGRYLVLVADAPIAFAFGQLRSAANGVPLMNSRILAGAGAPQTSILGVADLTRLGGVFALPVPAKPAATFSLVPRSAATGDGAAVRGPRNPERDEIVPFGVLTLTPNSPHLAGITPRDGSVLNASDPFVAQATFDTALDASSAANAITITNAITGAALKGGCTIGGSVVTFTPAEPLVPSSSYSISLAPTIRGANGAPFGTSVTSRFATRAIPEGNTTIRPDRIRITIPIDGRSTISGSPGALPAGAQAIAVRRGSYFVTAYQATASADGAFSFVAGNPGVDAIATTDAIDLQVIDAISRAIIAVIPMTPFVTTDGNGFLAPVESSTTFTTTTGVTLIVPAGAFTTPTLITTAASTKSEFAAVPLFDHDLTYATSVRVEFDGVASKRLDIDLPIPSGVDPTNRSFFLGYLGDSARGPRVMIVDTLRASNGRFTTAFDSTAAATPVISLSKSRTSGTSVGVDVKKTLLGITHGGTYSSVEINTGGAALAWGVIDGLQSGNDLFWSAFDALYAAHFYLTESRGRIAIPLLNNKQKFEVVGVDAATGLTSFSKVYDPLPDGDPGATVIVANPNPEKEGPYPVFGTPFRIETMQIDAEKIDYSVRNLNVRLEDGFITATDAVDAVPPALAVALFDSANGQLDDTRSNGLKVTGATGDRIALFIEPQDVDPYTSLSVVFSKKLYTGELAADADIDDYLGMILSLQASRDPAVEPYANVAGVHFRVDSGGLRVLIDLPASLQRGYAYQLIIGDALADRSGPGGGPGLRIGQAVLASGTTPPRSMVLRFRVRAPGGKLASFDIGSGAIRDEALNGNILLVSALDGGILAYDVADPASTGASSLLGGAQSPGTDSWAIASDHHGRVYATGLNALFGFLRAYRLEDFLPDATHPAPRQAVHRASGIVSFAPGASINMALSSATVLSDRPEAIPRKLQVLIQDREESFDSLTAFKQAATAAVVKAGDDGEFEILNADIGRDADLPYAGQRVTVENLTLDLRWSADAHANAKAHIEGIVARKDDRLRIIHNRMTYGVISLFGYGIGVYDLNAIESNDDPQPPSGYKAMREVVRITRADLRSECGWGSEAAPFPPAAIPNLTFTPEAAIITRDGTSDLFVYGVDAARGLLDLRIHPPASQAEGLLPADASGNINDPATAYLCDERPPIGFVLQNTFTTSSGSQSVYDPRITALRKQYFDRANRYPTGRFTGVSYYHWTLEAKDNKAVAPAPQGGGPAGGARGSIAGQRVSRDYLLLPGFELGVLVVEVGGDPAPINLAPGYAPLSSQHVVDVIWIPSGAYGVRAIPRTNLATVVDGEGRVLLVDLSRLDERFASNGTPIASDALFATATQCLSANGAYGVGLPDPRIVWQSDPQPDSISTLAPLIDSDTGFVYRGRLLKKSTDVIAAIDPRIQMKVDLAQPGGLSEVGGVVPLGVNPPKEITALIASGDPARKANASAAVFRLEVALPGAIADKLTASNNQLRVAVESERIAGATTPQTPDGFPRSHLRLTTADGKSDIRPVPAFTLRRLVPPSQTARLRSQKGFNRFISPWIIAIADPRAAGQYKWTFPSGATSTEAQAAFKAQQGCASCTPPPFLAGKGEQDDVWELLTTGRLVAVRPDLCASNCTQSVFSGTPYEFLGSQGRLFTRFSTVPADTIRPTPVLTAAQNVPIATGALQETTYLHSGEVAANPTDFDFGGRNGWNVTVDRSYRSRTLGSTGFGQGWDSPLFCRLRPLPDGNVEYRDGSGEVWLFKFNGAGYESPCGLFLRLARNERGWRLSDQKHRVTGFDALGRVTYEADEFAVNPDVADSGNVVRYLYDASGRLARIVDPVGRSTSLTWFDDSAGARAGLLARVTDWRNRSVDYDYDGWGRLTAVLLPDVVNTSGARPSLHYAYGLPIGDWNDRLELAADLTAIVDPGASTPRVSFLYATSGDARDRVTRQEWTATGELATFQYNSPTQVTTLDAPHQQRVFKLSAQLPVDAAADRVHIDSIEERDVDTSTVAVGELPPGTASGPSRAPATRVLSFNYNAEGLLVASTFASVATTTYAYKPAATALGLLPVSTETTPATASGGAPISRLIEYQSGSNAMDVSAFVKSISANGSKIESSEPSPLSKLTDSNDAVARTSELDAFGRPSHVSSAGGTDGSNIGSDTTLAYVSQTGPRHAIGRVSKISSNDGGTSLATETAYPSEDVIVEKDPRGVVTTTKLDAWDRPIDVAVAGPTAGLTLHQTYEYDAAGRVKRQKRDQSGTTVTMEYAYDALGRITSTTTDNAEVDGSLKSITSTTSYSLPQRTVTRTMPSSATVTEQLDGLGRIQTRTTVAPQLIVEDFAYDVAGNQVFSGEKCASCGTASWLGIATAYDAHGRAVATLNSDGTRVVSSGHDGWGNPKAVETRDGTGSITARSTLDFTATGNLKSAVTDLGGKSRQSEYRWDGAGRSTVSAVSGRASVSRFDALGRLQSSAAGEGSASGVQNAFSSYDVPPSGYSGALPTMASMKEKGTPPLAASYDYDTTGNVTRQKIGALEWQRQFDESGNLKSSASPARSPTQYTYDGRGALTKEHRADSSDLNFKHDAAGATRSYADPLEATSTETDLLGRPVKQIYSDGTTETFGYEGSRLRTHKDRQNRSYVYDYDESGRLHQIRIAGGELIEQRDYDAAGRIHALITADASVAFRNYDLEGRPHLSTQTRYKDHSAFTTKSVLDEYSQTHDYNEHGERISYTLPYSGTAPGWTTSVQLAYDAAGNVRDIQRTLSGSTAPKPLMSADFRSSGRPVHRDLTTDCAGAAGCIPASIVRQYGYDDTGGGQMNELKVIARGQVVAGTHATFDGLQVRQTALLGISGARVNEYTYDERSRLKTSAFAKPSGAAAAEEKVESFDFRTALDRPKSTPVDPPSMTFAHAPGHKIASMTRDGATRVFSYGTGAERIDDGRFAYDYDARGRMLRATEKPQGSNTTLRRISYDYSATDRIVGRTAEYAQLGSPTSTPQPGDWKLEDRAGVLESDALPVQITFIWDPISDQLVAIARAGATSSTDPNAGMLRQMIHGGLGYDDPIEVTAADGSATAAGTGAKASEATSAGATTASSAGLTRLYPIYDEISGSRQAILNATGEVVSRSVMQGAYGEDPVTLTGVAIDRIAIRAKKDLSGALTSVEVTIRATEPLDPTTVPTGARLAAVTPTGAVVRTATNAPKPQGSDTIAWTLTATEWSTLTSSDPAVVNGTILTPALLSIAATSTLRASAWSSAQPILPAPPWAIASQPVFSSSELPVESRQSLATFSPFVAAIAPSLEATSVVYNIDSLAAVVSTPISSSTATRAERLLTPSAFHGLPFAEPATALLYARARWLEPQTGSFLTLDPIGYRDSSNLYVYCAGDPVNCIDPEGLESLTPDERRTIQAKRATEQDAISRACTADPTLDWCRGVAETWLANRWGDKNPKPLHGGNAFAVREDLLVVNGAWNSEQGAQDHIDLIATSTKQRTSGVFNPTQGKIADLKQTAINKLNVRDETTKIVIREMKRRIAALPAGQTLRLVAHSQSAAIVSSATGYLTPSERFRIDLLTFGGAAWHYPSGFHSRKNVVNLLDFIAHWAGNGATAFAGVPGMIIAALDPHLEFTMFTSEYGHGLDAYWNDYMDRHDPVRVNQRVREQEIRRHEIAVRNWNKQ